MSIRPRFQVAKTIGTADVAKLQTADHQAERSK